MTRSNSILPLHVTSLIITAILLLCFLPVNGAIDHQLISPWVNADGTFFERENWWLATVSHHYVKQLIIAVDVLLALRLIISHWYTPWRQYRWQDSYVLIAMMISSSVIGLLKSQSEHACPWSLTQPTAEGIHWLTYSLNHVGKCFPGGHASAGFGLLAFYFAYRKDKPQTAQFYLWSALILGMSMGWAQMMRGAHFLSHNLWTLWWTWAVNVVLYTAYQYIRSRQTQTRKHSNTDVISSAVVEP